MYHTSIGTPLVQLYKVFTNVHTCTHRGFSRKLHEMVKQHKEIEDSQKIVSDPQKKEKFEPKNWSQLTERQLLKLNPVQKSKYMMV